MKNVEKILKSHPFMTSKFWQNTHAQTLLYKLMPYFKTSLPVEERRYIKLADGSKLAADCIFQPNKKQHPTIIVLNGFMGSSKSFFSRSIKHKAYHSGFNVILLMHRGDGDTIHLTKSVFAAYPHYDIPTAFEEFHKWGLKNNYLVGLSLGAWAALITLGTLEKKAKKYISGAVAINAPINVLDCWRQIEKYPLYDWMLLHSYKRMLIRRVKVDPPGTWDLKKLKKIKTKRQLFEEYLHTHTWSYPEKLSTIEEYHQKTDLIPLLPKISIPTLIINSYDDPLSPIEPLTKTTNPNIITFLTKHGGHGGFFTTKKLYGDLDGHWAQNRAMEFIRLLNPKFS